MIANVGSKLVKAKCHANGDMGLEPKESIIMYVCVYNVQGSN